jgi:hypothetical protein
MCPVSHYGPLDTAVPLLILVLAGNFCYFSCSLPVQLVSQRSIQFGYHLHLLVGVSGPVSVFAGGSSISARCMEEPEECGSGVMAKEVDGVRGHGVKRYHNDQFRATPGGLFQGLGVYFPELSKYENI